MAKFKTPVAMKVTEEQGKYLLGELRSMGYEENHEYLEGYIATNWNGFHYAVTITSHKPAYNRHIIEEYNPELFLAIAAMTKDEIPIIGEWLSYENANLIFKVKSYGRTNNHNYGKINKENPSGSGHFLKATLEELINHFSKPEETFVLPKKWKLEVTRENVDAVNKWRSFLGYGSNLTPQDCVNQGGVWIKMSMEPVSELITTEQFMEHVYKPAFNKEIPEEFYIHYCEGFTEDIFNALYDWAKVHSSGKVRGYNDIYRHFISDDKFWRFNFVKASNNNFGYGVDNHDWSGRIKTEYTLEQVKKLINYKPKTNKNECKKENNYENSYERESRENKQIDENLDSISSRERGKEIKIRTVSSRNLCERGSFSSSEKIARTRRTSSRIRAEKGDFNF